MDHCSNIKMPTNIMLVGGYGDFHFGDDLILASCLKYLRENIGSKRVCVASRMPDFTGRFHHIRTCMSLEGYFLCGGKMMGALLFPLRFITLLSNVIFLKLKIPFLLCGKDLRGLVAAIRASSTLWLVGGGYFHEEYIFTSLFCKGLLIIIFKFLGKRVAMTGAGLFEFNNVFVRSLSKRLFRLMDHLSVRDGATSKNTLLQLGVEKFEGSSDDSLYFFSGQAIKPPEGGKPYVVMSIHWKYWAGDHPEKISSLLSTLHRSYGLDVVFLPHSERDLTLLNAKVIPLASRAGISYRVLDAEKAGLYKACKVINEARIAIGSRFHLVVSAVSLGTPVIAISHNVRYLQKFIGFLDQFNITDNCVTSVHFDEIYPLIDRCINSNADLQRATTDLVAINSGKVKAGFETVVRMANHE